VAAARRRGVGWQAAAALAAGTANAVRNYGTYKNVGKALSDAYQGARKRRRTVPKTTRTIADSSAYQQNAETRFQSGRKLAAARITSRVVAAARESVVYQFRNYILDASAATMLKQDIGHVYNGTNRFFPAYLMDLTGCIQVANAATPMKRAYCNVGGATDGKIQWETQSGLDPAGAPSQSLQRIESPSGVANSSHSKSFLEWINLKLSFMGATSRPTRIQVQLIQFRDAEMDPWHHDGTVSFAHQAVWQSLMSRLTVNALHDWKNPDPKAIKILATKVVTFQPIDNQEADTRGHTHTMKWFHRVNKLLDYRQGGNVTVDDADFSTTKEIVNISGENFANKVDSRNKIFLYVTAYCSYQNLTVNAALHPSFEWNVTMKHSLIP